MPLTVSAAEVGAQDLLRRFAAGGATPGADHAQADAVAEADAAEAVAGGGARTSKAVLFMSCQPSVRPTAMRKSWAEISDGREAVDAQLADATRRRALDDAQVAQPRCREGRRRASARSIWSTRSSLDQPGSSSQASSCGASGR